MNQVPERGKKTKESKEKRNKERRAKKLGRKKIQKTERRKEWTEGSMKDKIKKRTS